MATLLTSELKEGMITSVDTYSSTGNLILTKDTVITKHIIAKLVSNDVLFVEVSDADNITPIELSGNDTENPIVNTPEFKKFKRRYDSELDSFKENLNDIVHKNSSYLDVDALLHSTDHILRASSSPLGVFTMLSSMKSYDDSTFNHSLNVSLICNTIAKWLDLPESKVEIVTAAGLLHDVGKLLIPDEIIKKPGKLTPEEYTIVKQHSQKGYELLKKRNVDIHIQYAALMHHEKCDGSGYPLGLKGDQIDWCAQIVTIADIYDAMTSNRPYRSALSPFTVINSFEEDGLKKYNIHYLMTFFDHVVNSYMNCKVKLSNGEEGDIVYINKVSLSKPMIKTTDNNFIDLSKSQLRIEKIY